ncbi:DUF47 domain-containing protein [Bacilliculturomica massiliensis]|uniref:DUF47 domain-containing protein n=1 Tax=Bacilliculturomica massiliensis TaxID=1917867 RepID=UPI001031ECB7|nr:DUF47 family protein [Bacilliculturomica massiliensis]
MARKRDMDYFDGFVSLVNYSCEAAAFLENIVEHYDPGCLNEKMKEIHAIEHQADIEKHLMMQKLAKEFITPIEREDIMSMAHEIDNVTDAIEDVVMQMYMFNIRSIRKEAEAMTRIIINCCDALRSALKEFHNFRKSESIHKLIIEVNRLEEEGDRTYTEAVRQLYQEKTDVLEIMGWTRIFECMEKCCDVCENVSDVIESVIMKNS